MNLGVGNSMIRYPGAHVAHMQCLCMKSFGSYCSIDELECSETL
jgi:hypothetical protein